MSVRTTILFLLFVAAPAFGNNELTIARATAPVADQVNTVTPARNLPGATIDTMLTVTNPLGNTLLSITTVKIVDVIPASVKLRVLDLAGTNGGPVEFMNGNLLTIPLGASGLTYAYPTGLEFSSNGTTWGYTPHDQGDGYDANVRAIRATMTGTRFTTGGSFRLRYRVMLK